MGYSKNWALPTLYMAGRYLRVFIINANKAKKNTRGELDFDKDGLPKSIACESSKNKILRVAARVNYRIFTLCISNRYVDIYAPRPISR